MNTLCEIFNNFLIKNNFLSDFYNELFIHNIKLKTYDEDEINSIFKQILNNVLTEKQEKAWMNMFTLWKIESLKYNKDFKLFIRFLKENNCYKQFINKTNINNVISTINLNNISSIIYSLNMSEWKNIFWIIIQLKWNIILAQKTFNVNTIYNFHNFIKNKNYYDEILIFYHKYKSLYLEYQFILEYKDFLWLMLKYPNNIHNFSQDNFSEITMKDIVKEFLIKDN